MAPRKKRISDIRANLTDNSGRLRHAVEDSADLPDDEPDPIDVEFEDSRPMMTANQVVAFNLMRERRARGWSQEQLGKALERQTGRMWSKASVSAAESSWRGGRVRRFDANELLALAIVFDTPIAAFFRPPTDPDLDDAVFHADVLDEIGIPVVSRERLVEAAGGALVAPRPAIPEGALSITVPAEHVPVYLDLLARAELAAKNREEVE